MVSFNHEGNILKLINKKLLDDGSVLKKIEVFSHSGAEYEFLKNDLKIIDFSARLNLFKDPKDWLSMKPNPVRYLEIYTDEEGSSHSFGELNEDNELHGRGIEIYDNGVIFIAYYEDGAMTGNYI